MISLLYFITFINMANNNAPATNLNDSKIELITAEVSNSQSVFHTEEPLYNQDRKSQAQLDTINIKSI